MQELADVIVDARIKQQTKAFVQREIYELTEALGRPPDHLVKVLRFHLLTEQLFEHIICAKLSRADRLLEDAGLGYFQKLCLVAAFDVVDDAAIQALKRLNKLRNQCSHEKDKKNHLQRYTADRKTLGERMVNDPEKV